MKRFEIDLRSLPVQIILSFIGLILLTAAAVGLPAIWLIHAQLERQAWAQVEQGSRAAQALYVAKQNEMTNLAILTAQRPTLRDLLVQQEQAAMSAYLHKLQTGAGLDLVLVCDQNKQIFAQAGQTISDALCNTSIPTGFQIISEDTTPQVLLFAVYPINGVDNEQGQVFVGILLDDKFATQMRTKTGLEHILLVNGQPVATSLADLHPSQIIHSNTLDDVKRSTFTLDDRCPYYAHIFPLPPLQNEVGGKTKLEAEMALAVSDITTTQQSLVWTLIGSIVIVASAGSVLGIFLARQISQPLARLTRAATTFSQGNFDSSPISVKSRVYEVDLVAQALENARIDLQHTLTELRRAKTWTEHLLEAIAEGIVTLDHQGRITFFSPGAERIAGCSHDEVLQRSCDDVLHVAETDKPFTHFIPPPGRRRKVTLEFADGRQAILAITGAQLMPPETDDAQVALVFRDVSEAEMMHRIMGHFLANIVHEFRTPLSSLAASAELLLDQASDLNPDELQELLTSLHLGILGLQTLVDNLLESASIEAGHFQVHTRPTNLGQIIAETIRLMQPLLEKHNQRLVLELPVEIPTVRADSRRTVQVLVNLISNASKYGPDEAEITISATTNEDWVRVEIVDRGQGVAPQHRSDLFRRFVYLDPDDGKSKYGVGLGLSVVKAVVEAQEGQVGVEDRPGGGAVFWFTLPVERV